MTQVNYYIISNGRSEGPYTLEGLRALGISPDTKIWFTGQEDWVDAGSVPQLASLFNDDDSAFGTYAQAHADPYFAMINGMRVGPESTDRLIELGLTEDTPVWRNGMADWQPARTQPELMEALSMRARTAPWGGSQNNEAVPPYRTYAPGSDAWAQHTSVYKQPQGQPRPHTNWLPWAIVATFLGFCGGCIGGILGIIAWAQASKSNMAYNMGDYHTADQANQTAKILTIIALVTGGLGLAGYLLYTLIYGVAVLGAI